MQKEIRIGTRASLMAVRQTEALIDALRASFPDRQFTMVTRKADADLDLKSHIKSVGGKQGAFITAMRDLLLAGKADIVMHSLKDLPGNAEYYADDRFVLGACLERNDPRDVLVLRSGLSTSEPAVIGTASVRRGAFLRRLYPRSTVVPFRGTADGRIERMDTSTPMRFNYGGQTPPIDALVLAKNGLERISLGHRISRVFEVDEMCPPVGQGVVVAECARDNLEVLAMLKAITHRETLFCMNAERAMLRELEGHCDSPIGGYAWIEGGRLNMVGTVVSLDGRSAITYRDSTDFAAPEALGARVGRRLMSLGAAVLIEESRNAG